MDDVMTTLERARNIEQEVMAIVKHIERLKKILSAALYISPDNKALYEDRLNGLISELEKRLEEYCEIKRKALEIVNRLTGDERAVIERYYLLGQLYKQIMIEMHWSERQIFLLRKRALKKLTGGNHDK